MAGSLDYTDRRIVVIGSGATAVTLAPELAKKAAQVTMLQRSPTYVVSRPGQDAFANRLKRHLPAKLAYLLTRWRLVLLGMWFYRTCRKKPAHVRALIEKGVRAELGPDYDIATHFTPRYNPWDQRLCLVSDSDLFRAIPRRLRLHRHRRDRHIRRRRAEAQIRKGAGRRHCRHRDRLVLELLGNVAVRVDGEDIDFSKALNYRGAMYSGVPNLAAIFGYTNASWTLKCDLTCEYVCRLLNRMDRLGVRQVTPRNRDPHMGAAPWVDLSSGYIRRAIDRFPKQGAKRPWKLYQNYALDILSLRYGSMNDGVRPRSCGLLEFSNEAKPETKGRAA